MSTIRMFLEWASEKYDIVFADWLYIHFLVRTLILILLIWIIIYAGAQLFQYLIAPLLVLFLFHVLFRAWNFLVMETFQEWVYIHYAADDKPFFGSLYPRLCDQIKRNRMTLANARYTAIIYRGRVQRVTARLMVIALTLGCLWVVVFGLYNQYAATPKSGQGVSAENKNASESEDNPLAEGLTDAVAPPEGTVATEGESVAFPDPWEWPDDVDIFFVLNEHGYWGSNVRERPSVQSERLEAVWGDIMLEYGGDYARDEGGNGSYWVKVITPTGTVGYINSTLLEIRY